MPTLKAHTERCSNQVCPARTSLWALFPGLKAMTPGFKPRFKALSMLAVKRSIHDCILVVLEVTLSTLMHLLRFISQKGLRNAFGRESEAPWLNEQPVSHTETFLVANCSVGGHMGFFPFRPFTWKDETWIEIGYALALGGTVHPLPLAWAPRHRS